ncbi:hypothetical protein B0H66DRAFT_537898 [Apodospora peruviana]|uniref:Uncharacterized protein n=1 Tax=Apodospora peruviana TaxID=516989 RepID=A0AAE0LYX7_9PEZI|nr:hypothetical protein B0H66DRAFT_537898 [Apodospora peruviana]
MVAVSFLFVATLAASVFAQLNTTSEQTSVSDVEVVPQETITGAVPNVFTRVINRIVRRGEGIHLVNCGNSSAVVYCANDSNCNFNPSSANKCNTSSIARGQIKWEGATKSCTFSTGTKFTWNIRSDAQSLKDYSNVGSGDNGFNKFTIFKDDKHAMFMDSNKNSCLSIYYCLP